MRSGRWGREPCFGVDGCDRPLLARHEEPSTIHDDPTFAMDWAQTGGTRNPTGVAPADPAGDGRPDCSRLQHEDRPVSDDDRPVGLKDALVGDEELLDLFAFLKVRLSKAGELLLRGPKASRPKGAPKNHAAIVAGRVSFAVSQLAKVNGVVGVRRPCRQVSMPGSRSGRTVALSFRPGAP